MTPYHLLYSATSKNLIRKLHPELKSIIRGRLKKLPDNPYVGKPLERKLSGYFTLRAREKITSHFCISASVHL